MERILIVNELFYPSTNGGGPVISLKNFSNLMKKKYEIYVLTYSSDLNSNKTYENIEANTWNKNDDINIYYIDRKNINLKKINKILREVNADYVYINSFFSPLSIKILLLQKNMTSKVILSPRGEFSNSALNIKKNKKTIYKKIFNNILYNKVNTWYSTSSIETCDIRNHFPKANIIQVPNIVELKNYKKESNKTENVLSIVFISRIVKMKNLIFCLDVLDKLPKSNFLINFDIYGPIEDKVYWNKCLDKIDKIEHEKGEHIRINYKGYVNHDNIGSIFKKYDIFFLPTLGENFGHIIYEGMSNGCIPLISNKTPWIDLNKRQIGWDLELNAEEYVDVLKGLIKMTSQEVQEINDRLYEYIEEYNSNNIELDKLYSIFSKGTKL